MQRFGLRLICFGISLFLFAGCAKQTPSAADSSAIFIGVSDTKAMSGRLLPEPKKTVSQPQAALEKSADTKNEYEVLPEKEPAAGVIPNDGTTSLSAEEQAKQDAAALQRYLREKVALNHRGDIVQKGTYLQVEYVDLETTQTAVKAALKDYKGTVVPIKYKKGVYTASQWNDIVQKIEAVPSVKAYYRSVVSIGRKPGKDYVYVRLTQDIPIVKKHIQALGYGKYVQIEVEMRTPEDATAEDTEISIIIGNPTSNDIESSYPGVDIFMIKDVVHLQVTPEDWAYNQVYTTGELLGKIQKTKATGSLGTFEARSLPVGTEIYATEHRDIFVAKLSGSETYIKYMRMIEG